MPPTPSPTPSLAQRPQLGEFEVSCGAGVRSAVAERETEGLKSGLPVPGESDKEAPRPHRLKRQPTQTHSKSGRSARAHFSGTPTPRVGVQAPPPPRAQAPIGGAAGAGGVSRRVGRRRGGWPPPASGTR